MSVQNIALPKKNTGGQKLLIRRFLNKKISLEKKSVKISIYVVVAAILIAFSYRTYEEYKKIIITQEEQQLLDISKSICRSIEVFIDDIEDSMKVVTLDKQFIKEISNIEQGRTTNISSEKFKSYCEAEGKPVTGVYYYDKNAKLITKYSKNEEVNSSAVQNDISTAIETKKTFVGRVFADENKKSFIVNIYQPVFDENSFKGVMVASISLDAIFDKLIAPVKIGEKGYAMVKDQEGIIIMHNVKEQVGMDVIDTRKQTFPGLDFRELEELIDNQLKGVEGTALYHSYWWGDNELKKVKKFNAYSPVYFGDYFWIVAITMAYDEIQGPINTFLFKIIGIDFLVAVVLFLLFSILIQMKKDRTEHERETEYLRMMNESSEQLRKKETELYHSHKLKMIGTLAGGIAHDINNLLTPIMGYSELMLMTMPKDSEYYEEIEEIYSASQKGKDLVGQILVFSRKDNGIVKIESININEVVSQSLKLVRSVLPKKVVIKENIIEDCGHVRANFTQLHQVIFNLCTNAYQSIKSNQGTIEVSLKRVNGSQIIELGNDLSKGKDYVEFTIKDNGCGMDDETKTRIFDPFFTTKAIGEGTGLGLFVVQSIIDKYEGTITVESELGYGSCFKVYLPIIEGAVNLEINETNGNLVASKNRILVVDDNEEVVKFLEKSLKHLGYRVIGETDSVKALKLFEMEHDNIDLVITDYSMPNIKGNELAAHIKKIKKDTGVILITGYIDGSVEKNDKSKIKFIDGCISKPVEISKLSELIAAVMSKSS